jgi:hypothetical protein
MSDIYHIMVKPSGLVYQNVVSSSLEALCNIKGFRLFCLAELVLTETEIASIYSNFYIHPERYQIYLQKPTKHFFIIGAEINGLLREFRGERTEPWEPIGKGIRGFLRQLDILSQRSFGRWDDYIHVSDSADQAQETLNTLAQNALVNLGENNELSKWVNFQRNEQSVK